MGKDTQKPKPCLFCSNRRNSDEHIFAVWVNETLGVDRTHPQAHRTWSYEQSPADPLTFQGSVKVRHGPVGSRRDRSICKKCNNGWMSALEADVGSFARPMLVGESVVLDEHQRAVLATWLEKTAIIWERVDRKKPVSTSAQREQLRLTRQALWTTEIWVGLNSGPDLTAMDNYGVAAGIMLRRSELARLRPNFRLTLLTIGRLLALVCFRTGPEVSVQHRAQAPEFQRRLLPLWPTTGRSLAWPPAGPIEVQSYGVLLNRDQLHDGQPVIDRSMPGPDPGCASRRGIGMERD